MAPKRDHSWTIRKQILRLHPTLCVLCVDTIRFVLGQMIVRDSTLWESVSLAALGTGYFTATFSLG